MHKIVLSVTASLVALIGSASAQPYTFNGKPLDPETQKLFAYYNLPAGPYYVTGNGGFGRVGFPPVASYPEMVAEYEANRTASERRPSGQSAQTFEDAAGIVGTRIFWVYSPSIFSSATGGSSGYVHLCPRGIAYRSSEGSFSVGGEYDSRSGANDSWAGGAHVSRSAGQWFVEAGMLTVRASDGSSQSVPLSQLRQGSWTRGRTKYAAERGKASCPR